MRKILSWSAIAAAMLLAGCSTVAEVPEDAETIEMLVTEEVGAEILDEQPVTDEMPEETLEELPNEDAGSVVEIPEVTLVPGIWTWEADDIPAGYYIINSDGMSGSTLPYDTGIGADFDIEVGINEITFHFEGEDGVLYQIVGGDASYIEMRESDSSPLYIIQYIADGTAADLEGVFFTDMELADMARAYYEKQTGIEAESAGAQANEDNTVTIVINNGEAQYTVDRHNAEGFDDLTGEAIMIIPVE